MNDVDRQLPTGRYEMYHRELNDVVLLINRFLHGYWNDYPSIGGIRQELTDAMGGASSHFNNGEKSAYLHIHLPDREVFTLRMPRSEAGCNQMQHRFQKAIEAIAQGRVPVTQWADRKNQGKAATCLCLALHGIARRHDPSDRFLADRMAVLLLARATGRSVKNRSFRRLVSMAEERLSQQKDRWSRRGLSHLGVQRTMNLLHIDRDEDLREDIFPIDARIPDSVTTRRNVRLSRLLEFEGCKAMGLNVTKMKHHPSGLLHLHTDAWHPSQLVELKPTPHTHGKRQ